jgi:hypothetical protein
VHGVRNRYIGILEDHMNEFIVITFWASLSPIIKWLPYDYIQCSHITSNCYTVTCCISLHGSQLLRSQHYVLFRMCGDSTWSSHQLCPWRVRTCMGHTDSQPATQSIIQSYQLCAHNIIPVISRHVKSKFAHKNASVSMYIQVHITSAIFGYVVKCLQISANGIFHLWIKNVC